MDDHDPFIIRANIERYRRLLETEQNEERRDTLRRLLADAEGELNRSGGPRAEKRT
jgi:hypothetical protein